MRTEDIILKSLVKWWKDQEGVGVVLGGSRVRIVKTEFDIGVKIDGSFYDLRDLAREIIFELERNT